MERIDVSNYSRARQAVLACLEEQHGELNEAGMSIYEAQDGTQFLISYANKNERGLGWLAVDHDAMRRLNHPQGFFAFAFIDQDDRKAYFFKVPIGVNRTKVIPLAPYKSHTL